MSVPILSCKNFVDKVSNGVINNTAKVTEGAIKIQFTKGGFLFHPSSHEINVLLVVKQHTGRMF